MHSNPVSSWIPALDGVPRLRRFTVPLEEGGKIRSCKLAYATFGQLSPQKDNAILILTWYSGTSKIMEQATSGRDEPSIPIMLIGSYRSFPRYIWLV
jgi:homoserine acetyltransferase